MNLDTLRRQRQVLRAEYNATHRPLDAVRGQDVDPETGQVFYLVHNILTGVYRYRLAVTPELAIVREETVRLR